MPLKDFGTLAVNLDLGDETEFMSGNWIGAARHALAIDGAVLVRGPVRSEDAAGKALAMLGEELVGDAFWSTPRSKVKGKTLTATDYPSSRTIPLHCEASYMRSWPRLLAFHSLAVAAEGGETTICDLDVLSQDLRNVLEPFQRLGVSYERTFHAGVDLNWQQAFQTESRQDVEEIGQRFGMDINWLPDDTLQTAHCAQGTIQAEDGCPLYFNQAHLFHPSGLDDRVFAALQSAFGKRMPRSARYGDGAEIEDETLEDVREALEQHQTKMCWRVGDILILDNMRYLHGRLPFSGARRLHVALARAVTSPVRTPLFAEPQPRGHMTVQPAGLVKWRDRLLGGRFTVSR